MKASRSPAPVQSRLERLRNKGYIDWIDGKARTIRILHQPEKGLSIAGEIAAGGLVEPFNDEKTRLDLSDLFAQSDCYVLLVVGDNMIEDLLMIDIMLFCDAKRWDCCIWQYR